MLYYFKKHIFIVVSISLTVIASVNTDAQVKLIQNKAELDAILPTLKAGDSVRLASGIWKDVSLSFRGKGEATKPIIFEAEVQGKTIFEGNSKINLSGEYVVVSGLVFKNGSTNGSVIEYREGGDKIANFCRVTNCVIDDYNSNDRTKESTWIQLYGKNNRFDHNYVANKKNEGVTMAVNLNDERNRENYHQIDHNFFGPRPPLGSNGGETLRIGVSTYSLTSSRTIVEENYFYQCSGEVEIISIKSCDNIVRKNTFVECEGGLVLRHGNRNLLEGNFFFGNNKPNTGGIRVINAGHTIKGNYLENLKGKQFRSALTIMNAVPNSAINRYHQVKDVVIEGNTFLNCDNIEFCAGKDNERTARPENVVLKHNLFIHQPKDSLYQSYDDISGIKLEDNWQIGYAKAPKIGVSAISKDKISTLWNGLPMPDSKPIATVKNCGTSYYQPNFQGNSFPKSGKVWKIKSGLGTIQEAILLAKSGDAIELTESGNYIVDKTFQLKFPLTIYANPLLKSRPKLIFEGEKNAFSYFSIENGGGLSIKGLSLNGSSKNSVAECAIRTSKQPTCEHYKLFVENCEFYDYNDGRKNAFKAYQGTYADTIQFKSCIFRDISGEVISLAAEKEDKGIYNAEHVIIENCLFANLLTGALDIYRGGNDESTLGPFLIVNHCTFHNVGNVELGSVLKVLGVQWTEIQNCLFSQSGRSGRVVNYEDFGWTHNVLSHCNMYQSGKVQSFYTGIVQQPIWNVKPTFINSTGLDYRLTPSHELAQKGSDKLPIGVSNLLLDEVFITKH
jgi:poly(beta-D-mannuronate) lyase